MGYTKLASTSLSPKLILHIITSCLGQCRMNLQQMINNKTVVSLNSRTGRYSGDNVQVRLDFANNCSISFCVLIRSSVRKHTCDSSHSPNERSVLLHLTKTLSHILIYTWTSLPQSSLHLAIEVGPEEDFHNFFLRRPRHDTTEDLALLAWCSAH